MKRDGFVCKRAPVLLGDVYSQHLQRFHTLHHPSVSLADSSRLHLQEGVGHSAPQHRANGLDVQSRRTLRNGILVFALEDGRRDGHGVLQIQVQLVSLMMTNMTVWGYGNMRMCSPWFWPVQTGRDWSSSAAQTLQERVLCWAPPKQHTQFRLNT